MARTPSCYLYLAFLIHFSAFGSLLVGYSTPYWTLVKMSTGEILSLGLVVSCDRQKCDMLHVTSARSVFVIIFGMCTFCILLSLFSIQIFCLALCNRSCMEKSMGTCLSYYSLFIAFSIGGTLGLYQIDLREENKPDVIYMKIGWSRYSLIGSSAGFFLGAWLNAADYFSRNKSRRRELMKKAEIKAKVAVHAQQHRPNCGPPSRPSEGRKLSLSERRQQYANLEKWGAAVNKNQRNPRMCSTVDNVMRDTASRRNLQRNNSTVKDRWQTANSDKSVRVSGNSSGRHLDKAVRQMTKDNGVKSINVREAPRTVSTTGSNPKGSTTSSERKSNKREEGIVGLSDAASKYRLDRLQELTVSLDERRKLSVVQEENKGSNRKENDVPSRVKCEKKVLNRQETQTLVGHTLIQSTISSTMGNNVESNTYNKDDRKNPPSKLSSVETVTPRHQHSTVTKQSSVDSVTPRTHQSMIRSSDSRSPLHHTKPHPLQRDDNIKSVDNSLDVSSKLKPIKKSVSIDEYNTTRKEIPPLNKDSSRAAAEKTKEMSVSFRADSKEEKNKGVISGNKLTGKSSEEKRIVSLPSLDSANSGELSEEQLKRKQIVESILNARKNRKKKRITQ